MHKKKYDLIIVGGGAMGMATAYYAMRQGANILVIDRHDYFLPNSGRLKSNSVGATRQFRVQYSEKYMAALAMKTIPYWKELEAMSDASLVSDVGSLWFGNMESDGSEGQIKQAMHTMEELNIPYEELTIKEIEKRFQFNNLPPTWGGFLQKDGGSINIPATFEVFYQKCVESGQVTFLKNTPVSSIKSTSNSVAVMTASGIYEGKKAVLAVGPYTNELIKSLNFQLDIEIWQMVSCYFKKRQSEVKTPSWFAFADSTATDPGFYYGFEEVSFKNKGYIRVAPAFASHIMTNPTERTDSPNRRDIELTEQWIRQYMPALEPTAEFQASCMAALPTAGDKKMFLDFVPQQPSDNIVLFSAGWAFKFAPIIGLACAELALEGQTQFDVSAFAIPKEEKKLLTANRGVKGSNTRRVLPF